NRRSHEAKAPMRSASTGADDLSWREVQAILHEELNRLPEAYRAALVLCFLQSQTLDEAARELGCGKGALRGRLQRARQLLHARLARRGLGAMALVAAWAVTRTASATCVAAAAKAAVTIAAGGAARTVVSAKVAALAESVVKTMLLSKLKLTAVVFAIGLSTFAMLGFGLAAFTDATLAADGDLQARPRQTPTSELEKLQGRWIAV